MVEYKRTLAMDRDVDIFRDDQKQGAFFEDVIGVQQELKILLATVKGEDPFNPNFGLDVFKVAESPESVVKREVRIALQKDNRVAEVPNISVEDRTNRRVDIQVDIRLVNDETLQITQRIGGQA